MSVTTILRGFKVSVATLDAFIEANGLVETNGAPPFFHKHPDNDPISALLYSKIAKAGGTADKNNFRVLMPVKRGFGSNRVAYVTYTWLPIYAHLELDLVQQLPIEIPNGFEDLREEILSFAQEEPLEYNKIPNDGKMGVYAVVTGDGYGIYSPKELDDRVKVPQACGLCEMTFNDEKRAFTHRQRHRIDVHGSKEGTNPLPET
ncbi:hypothetical protein BGZ63DRAFT_424908 [Mariannaea sp. PMI_226]|nr:hypothetical protein BGZ63DRAFT_424908 [Mariannaea sp. PMI_226]